MVQMRHPDTGMVVDVSSDRAATLRARGYTDADEGDTPATSASKSEWVDYAESQGMDRDEADSLTKADLVERFG